MRKSILPGNEKVTLPKRPFPFTALCLFSFIFFGLMSLLLLASLVYSGSFRDLINTYVTGDPVSYGGVLTVLGMMFLLTSGAFIGILLMWRMKRVGYYIFGIPVLIISGYHLLQAEVPVFSTAILILLLILFGLFFRKLQ